MLRAAVLLFVAVVCEDPRGVFVHAAGPAAPPPPRRLGPLGFLFGRGGEGRREERPEEEHDEQCGIVHEDGSVEVVEPPAAQTEPSWMEELLGPAAPGASPRRRLPCSQLLTTNCSDAAATARLCPDECPFLEFSSYSTCGHACVKAAECGKYRPAYSLPNPVTNMCSRCPSSPYGCLDCDARACWSCRKGFYLKGAECIYHYDYYYVIPMIKVLGLLLVVVLLVIVYYYCRGTKNAAALQRGVEHSRRCRPHQVEFAAGHEETRLYPLWVNVHAKNVVGIGFALYYNHMVFVAVTAVLSWLILSAVGFFMGSEQKPIWDCSSNAQTMKHGHEEIVVFAKLRCLMALCLWLVLTPASVAFAFWQEKQACVFRRSNPRMQSYAISVRNLPPDATDPNELQAFFEKILGRPVVGVSIGYRIDAVRATISRLLGEHLEDREAEATAGARVREPMDAPRALEARSFLEGLRCSGEAFLVTHLHADVEEIFRIWDRDERIKRRSSFMPSSFQSSASSLARLRVPRNHIFRGRALELLKVSSEPTSIVWENLGSPTRHILLRFILAVGMFLVLLGAFHWFFLGVVTQYVTNFAEMAGQAPKAWQTFALSICVAIGNVIIANYVWLVVPRLGFARKDQQDILVFVTRTLFVVTYTFGTVLSTAQKLAAVSKPESVITSVADAGLKRIEELGFEVAVGEEVSKMFLQANFVLLVITTIAPYFFKHWFKALLIRSGLLGSKMTARECESQLVPDEIYLPWDYPSHIQLPSIVFFPLMLAERPGSCHACTLSGVLLIWCIIWYCMMRAIHLRMSIQTFFTTSRLNTAVLYFWAFPLSLPAIVAARWAMRAFGNFPVTEAFVCVLAFVGSILIYVLSLFKIIKHQRSAPVLAQEENSWTYASVLARLRYSYFNTNPGYVLMSDHLSELGLPRTTWYEPGKTHLQTPGTEYSPAKAALFSAGQGNRGTATIATEMLTEAFTWLRGGAGARAYVYSSLEPANGHPADD